MFFIFLVFRNGLYHFILVQLLCLSINPRGGGFMGCGEGPSLLENKLRKEDKLMQF